MFGFGILSASILCFLVSLTIMIFSSYDVNLQFMRHQSNSLNLESSVWCVKGLNNSNLCKFRNVCYDSSKKTIFFYLSNRTIIKGLKNYKDLQRIQLSSVLHHNQFYANLSVIDGIDYASMQKTEEIFGKVFLMSRFKPDNLMHVIHDDLLPLFLTFEYMCGNANDCMKKYHLVFHDNHNRGPYFDLYKLFSNWIPVILTQDLSEKSTFMCFEEMITGLVQDGIIYDYGFGRVQGPVKNFYLNQRDLFRFSSHIRHAFKMEDQENRDNSKINVVIINRTKTRKILNLNRLIEMVKDGCRTVYGAAETVNISVLNLSEANFVRNLMSIMNCDIIIGMHGAGMILTVFSKKKPIVFEIFPFGIQSEFVSYLKPISQLEPSPLVYFVWKNTDKNRSVPHPDAHPLHGGIRHLDDVKKEEIRNTEQVPAVKCCNDPNYLYHMYQDTWIADEFQTFFAESLANANANEEKSSQNAWFFPAPPGKVTCKYHINKQQLIATWSPPFNVMNTKALTYNIYIRDENNEFVKYLASENIQLTLHLQKKIDKCPKFYLWIYVSFEENNSRSKDVYCECSCVKN